LLASEPLDLILSDDGMQHYRLARDLELVLIDAARGLGNRVACRPGRCASRSSACKASMRAVQRRHGGS
jgi:tetraacyldisaccharide-1-P 4'-kinase